MENFVDNLFAYPPQQQPNHPVDDEVMFNMINEGSTLSPNTLHTPQFGGYNPDPTYQTNLNPNLPEQDYTSRNYHEINDDGDDEEEDDDDEVLVTGSTHNKRGNPVMASIQEEGTSSQPSKGKGKAKGKKRVSKYLEWFDVGENDKGVIVAKCKQCGKELTPPSSAGTNHLNRHVKAHAKDEAEGRGKYKQTKLNMPTTTYPKVPDDLVTMFLVSSRLPLSTSDDERFTTFCQTLNPSYQPMSRQTITRHVKKLFLIGKLALATELQSHKGSICLTTDAWKASLSSSGENFTCITAHWVDKDWVMQKRIISFRTMPYPHTATECTNHVMDVLKEFVIHEKNFTMSFDNATYNTATATLLTQTLNPPLEGKFFHVRCACHVLNLCVRDFLRTLSYVTNNINHACNIIRGSGQRVQKYSKLCQTYGMKFLKPKIAEDIKWNSTFTMLDRAVEYRVVITEFLALYHRENQVSENEWDIATGLVEVLRPFYKATDLLSGTYYPTSHLLCRELYTLSKVFVSYRSHVHFGGAIVDMETKFNKYYADFPLLPQMATCMDPRIKIKDLENLLYAYYENMRPGIASSHIDVLVNRAHTEVFNDINTLYDSYSRRLGDPTEVADRRGKEKQKMSRLGWDFLRRGSSGSGRSSSSSGGRRNELAIYFNSAFEENDDDCYSTFDILAWWKARANVYPVLSVMARDLLTSTVSTVPSEAAFSAAGRIVSAKRNRLGTKLIEQLICLSDWDDARLRKQGNDRNLEHEDHSSPEEDNLDLDYLGDGY